MSMEVNQRTMSDDKKVFAELLERHQRELFRFIFSTLHRFQDAEDVFQLTAVTLWEKFDTFEPGSNFGAWAKGIARYKVLEFIRSRAADRVYFNEEVIAHLATEAGELPETYDVRVAALESCREKLSTNDRRLLALCYARDNSIERAARQLSRPSNSVRNSLVRIRRCLHACIERTLVSEGCR